MTKAELLAALSSIANDNSDPLAKDGDVAISCDQASTAIRARIGGGQVSGDKYNVFPDQNDPNYAGGTDNNGN